VESYSCSNSSTTPSLVLTSHPVSSNKFVGGKATHNVALPKPQKVAKEPRATNIVEHPESEYATGGMEEEDDTLEKEVALASPMKGSESCQAGKVCYMFSFP
jgi:hypothetical protein